MKVRTVIRVIEEEEKDGGGTGTYEIGVPVDHDELIEFKEFDGEELLGEISFRKETVPEIIKALKRVLDEIK